MKFSSKTRYGLRLMLHLAINHHDNQFIQLNEIAKKEDISLKYLEQIISVLKSTGLLNVARGARGGYALIKKPDEIKISEIVVHLNGSLALTDCVEDYHNCNKTSSCVLYEMVWLKLSNMISDFFHSITLKDLVDACNEKAGQNMYYI